MITITPFEESYTQDVIDLVLHFQNDGTRPVVTVADQPDLLHITDAYFRIGGSFWIARDGGKACRYDWHYALRKRRRCAEKVFRL